MFRYNIQIIFLVFTFTLFNGCSSSLNMSSSRSFDSEDKHIFSYLLTENAGNYKKSSQILDTLFKKSNKPEYLLAKLRIDSIHLNQYDTSINLLDSYIASYPNNLDFLVLAFEISIFAKKYEASIEYAKQALVFDSSETGYIRVANAYILEQNFHDAISYLERAYSFSHNEAVLEKLVTLMYLYDNHKEQALSYLETHIRLHTFSEKIAQKLAFIYKENNNIDGLISIYKRLSTTYNKEEYSNMLIQLYVLQDKKKDLINFLMSSSTIDMQTFMSLYRYIGNKQDGYKIAMQLYKKSNNINFLAQAAMMEYELSLLPKSQHNIDDAVSKLTAVVEVESNADYYNYLGYILINHGGDLQEGIKYVKKALEVNPTSPYYLDSLAWGYYKLKKYSKAYDIMQQVVAQLGRSDKEVMSHLSSIEEKLKKIKKKPSRKNLKKPKKTKKQL